MSNTVSNNTVSDGNGVGNSNWASHSVGNGMGNSVTNTDNVRVRSSAVIGDLSDVASGVVGVVVHMLDATVRKVDRVGAVPHTGAVIGLSLLESGARVVVVDAVLEGVGGHLG